MSWAEAFAADYETWSASMTADIPFYVGLARQASGPLVELAVGNGRVAVPVALATGRRVRGIDSSPAMLEQARIRAARADVDLDLQAGDIRDLHLDEPAWTARRVTQGQARAMPDPPETFSDGIPAAIWA